MKLRFKLFFFFQFFSNGVFGPFFAVFLSQKGFTGAQIGLMIGLMPIVSLVFQPLWSYLSDVFNQRRVLLLIGSLGVALACFGFTFAETFIFGFLCSFLFSVMIAPIGPISNAILIDYLESVGKPDEFSLVRLWGSLGFGISSILMAGLFLNQILTYFSWFLVGIFIVLGLLSLLLPESGKAYSYVDVKGWEVITKNKDFAIFLLGSVFFGATLGICLNFQTIHLQFLDASDWLIGVIISLQALVEIPMMLAVPYLLRRYSKRRLIILGAIVLPFRWLIYIFVEDPVWVLPTQIFNGISTVSFLVIAIALVDQLVHPKWRAPGQGLYSTAIFGIGSGLGVYFGGNVMGAYGVRSVWVLSLVMSLIALGLFLLVFRRMDNAERSAEGIPAQ